MIRSLLVLPCVAVLAAFGGSQPTEHVVGQAGRAFSPAELTVRAGDRVLFRNDDDVIHNVFSTTQAFAFNLRSQRPGTAAAVPFRERGTVAVRCAFHPQMRLTINVR